MTMVQSFSNARMSDVVANAQTQAAGTKDPIEVLEKGIEMGVAINEASNSQEDLSEVVKAGVDGVKAFTDLERERNKNAADSNGSGSGNGQTS